MPDSPNVPAQPTDEALLLLASQGDQGAFREVFERYRQKAYRVAYRFLGHHEEALDAVQDSFIKAYRGLDGFERRSQFRTWFMRIVTNTCLDRRRSRSGESAVPLEDELIDTVAEDGRPHAAPDRPLDVMQADELRVALHRALGRLTEAHRAVFVLHAEEGLTYRETAETLGVNEGTVMSRLFHARKNLQKILANRGLL